MNTNLKKIGFSLLLIFLFVGNYSCSQLKELQSFSKCEFKLNSINILAIDNVNVSHVKNVSDLDVLTVAKLGKPLISGKMPITYIANIEVNNPNSQKAALSKMLLNVLYNNVELVQSEINQQLEVMPLGKAIIPIQLTSDIGNIVKGESINSLLGLLLGNNDVPSVFTVKLKPSFKIGPAMIQYPGYITLSKEFKSK